MSTFKCLSCGVEKQMGEFTPNKHTAHGRQYHCKTCINAAARAKLLAKRGGVLGKPGRPKKLTVVVDEKPVKAPTEAETKEDRNDAIKRLAWAALYRWRMAQQGFDPLSMPVKDARSIYAQPSNRIA